MKHIIFLPQQLTSILIIIISCMKINNQINKFNMTKFMKNLEKLQQRFFQSKDNPLWKNNNTFNNTFS